MRKCRTDALGRNLCAGNIQDRLSAIAAMDGRNCETIVTTAPPLIDNGWTQAYECPHGVMWFVEPTSEQQAEWARDGLA